MMQTHQVEKILGYNFKDKALLNKALTHKTANQNECYKGLDILGDVVWRLLIVEEFLNRAKPLNKKSIQNIQRARYLLERNSFLSQLCVQMGIDKHIKAQGDLAQKSQTVKASVIEALIGAIYLDANRDINIVRRVFQRIFLQYINKMVVELKQVS